MNSQPTAEPLSPQLDFTSLFEKLEKVEVSKSSRIASDDEEFLEKLQRERDSTYNQLKTCLSLLQPEAEKQKELNLSSIQQGESWRNNDPYVRGTDKSNAWHKGHMFDFNYSLVAIQKQLSKLNAHFFNKIIWYFNSKYHLTLSSSITEELSKIEDIHFEQVLDYMFNELDGLDLTESGINKVITDFRDKIYGPYSYRGAIQKGRKIIFDSYFYLREPYNGGHEIGYSSREDLNVLISALSYFEQKTLIELNHIRRSFPDGNFDVKDKFYFQYSDKLDYVKLYKNNRMDLEFTSSALAKEFYEMFELKPAQPRN